MPLGTLRWESSFGWQRMQLPKCFQTSLPFHTAAVWAVPTCPPQSSTAVARAICLQTPTKQQLPLGHFSSSPCPPEKSSHQAEPSPAMCTGHEAESGAAPFSHCPRVQSILRVNAEQRPLSFSCGLPWKTELVERWAMGLRSCTSTSLRSTDCSVMAHILWQSLDRHDFASKHFNQAGGCLSRWRPEHQWSFGKGTVLSSRWLHCCSPTCFSH